MSTPVLAESIRDNYLNVFEDRFPGVQERFDAACQLANPVLPPPSTDHVSDNTLVAHWGEDERQFHETARYLYNLPYAAKESLGSPVIVFREGTAADVLDPDDSQDPYLTDDVMVDYGIVYSGDLVHGYRGNLDTRSKLKRMGLAAPYLGFGVFLSVFPGTYKRLSVDVLGLGNIEVVKPADAKKPQIPVYVGTVPLTEPDPLVYGKLAQKIPRDVFMGHDDCNLILRALARKSRQDNVRGALSYLATARV